MTENFGPTGTLNLGRKGPRAIVMVAAAAVFLGVLLLAGISVLDTSSNAIELQDLPPVAGAPEADYVMTLTEFGTAGPDIDRQFFDEGGIRLMTDHVIVAGSTEFIASVLTPYGVHNFYRWSEVPADTDPANVPVPCFGYMSGRSGSSTCGEDPAADPDVAVGLGSTNNDGQLSFNLTLTQLPEDAAWVVVETAANERIAAGVVANLSHLEWPSVGPVESAAVTATVLDASMNEIWTSGELGRL